MKRQMPGALATCLGFLAASATPPAAFAIAVAATGDLGAAVLLFLVTFPYSVAATFVFAAPVYFLLRRFAPGRSRWVLATGTVSGFLIGILVALVLRSSPNIQIFAPIGAFSGLVFWLIWRLGAREAEA